jgi:hypothetical protein
VIITQRVRSKPVFHQTRLYIGGQVCSSTGDERFLDILVGKHEGKNRLAYRSVRCTWAGDIKMDLKYVRLWSELR